MFTMFQIPIIDVRQYIPSYTYGLNKPSWPIPDPGSEFIRQFGAIRERNRGGITAFAGEEIFCQARHAIRLANKLGIIVEKQDSISVAHNLFLRRFYFEGRSVAKLELGFKQTKPVKSVNRQESDWLITAQTFADAACLVAPRNTHETMSCSLVCSGSGLSSLYLNSTTSKSTENRELQSWWVDSGEPMLLFEYQATKGGVWPYHCKKVDINLTGINLGFQRVYVSGRKLNIWYVEKAFNEHCKLSDVRALRLHLLRFHAEVQSLKRVLRLISQKKIEVVRGNPASELLQQYLQDASGLIAKERRYGINQKAILDAILNAYDLVSAGERESLLQKLSSIRKNILLTVERITSVTDDSVKKIIVHGDARFYEACKIKEEVGTVTNFDIKFGDNTVVHGDFVVAQSIQDSFNKISDYDKNDNLKTLLTNLTEEVAKLTNGASSDTAQEISGDMKILIDEALKEKPREAYFKLSAKGIVEAAKSFGEASSTVINLVEKVLSILL